MAVPPSGGTLGGSTGFCPRPPASDTWFNQGGADTHGRFSGSKLPDNWAMDPTWSAPLPTFMIGGQLAVLDNDRVPCLIASYYDEQMPANTLICWDAVHTITILTSLSTDPTSSNYSTVTLPWAVDEDAYLLIGEELVQVTDMDEETMIATISRGELGTTVAAHSDGIVCSVAYWAQPFSASFYTQSEFAITQGTISAQLAIWLDTDEGTDGDGNHLGTLFYLDAATGETIWSVTERNVNFYCFTATPGALFATTVYYATYDDNGPVKLIARNTKDGSLKWSKNLTPYSSGSGTGTGTTGIIPFMFGYEEDDDAHAVMNGCAIYTCTGLPIESDSGILFVQMLNPNDTGGSSVAYLGGISTVDGSVSWTTALNADVGGGAFIATTNEEHWAVTDAPSGGPLAIVGVATIAPSTGPRTMEVVAVTSTGGIAWRCVLGRWETTDQYLLAGNKTVTPDMDPPASDETQTYVPPGTGGTWGPGWQPSTSTSITGADAQAGETLPWAADLEPSVWAPHIICITSSGWILTSPGPVTHNVYRGFQVHFATAEETGDLDPPPATGPTWVGTPYTDLGIAGWYINSGCSPVYSLFGAISSEGSVLWSSTDNGVGITPPAVAGTGPLDVNKTGLTTVLIGSTTSTIFKTYNDSSSSVAQEATVEGCEYTEASQAQPMLFGGAIYMTAIVNGSTKVVRIGTPVPPN